MLDIFDILGPVMVGPSSSHTAGAVRIGRMARTLLGAEVARADIGLHGSFADTGRGHGTDRALVAGLLGMKPDDLGIPQSFEIAANQGLEFHFHTARLRDAHPNTAVLTVESADGRKLELQAASTRRRPHPGGSAGWSGGELHRHLQHPGGPPPGRGPESCPGFSMSSPSAG